MSDSDKKGAFQADVPADAGVDGGEAGGSLGRASEAAAVAADPPRDAEGLAAETQSLRAQLDLSTAKGRETLARLKEEHEKLLRTAADLENYKKRAAREREEVQRFGNEKLLKDLLPVVDGLDRALAAAPPDDPLADGVRLVRASLEQALAKHGISAFSALGERFDPALHEALLQVATADAPPGTVVVEHSRGFKLHGRLVRPAMVGVAVAAPGGPGETSNR